MKHFRKFKLKLLGSEKQSAQFKTVVLSLAAVFILIGAAAAVVKDQSSYAIYVDGNVVANAENEEQVNELVRTVESRASDMLGYEYSMSENVKVASEISDAAPAEDIEEALLKTVDGIDKLYTIRVNGEIAGASDVFGELDLILTDIIDEYSMDGMVSVSVIDDVVISKEYVSVDELADPDIIAARLDPKNSLSKFSLRVKCSVLNKYTEILEHEVEEYDDPDLFETLTELEVEGVDGEQEVTESITYINGIEQSRTVTGVSVIKEPVTEVIAIGTKPHELTQSWGRYIWPTWGVITSEFGPRSPEVGSRDHKGMDIAGVHGRDIVAADGGEVIMSQDYYGYGLLIQIRHDDGTVSYYGHCSELLVEVGERVYQGQLIARMGSTGVSSGDHLHFEIRVDDNKTPVNPRNYLPEE